MISSSPTGVRPVFEAIAAAATTLCGADFTGLFRFDGTLVHFEAQHGWNPEDLAASQRAFPQLPGEGSVTARAILAAAVVQVADVSQDPDVVGPLRSFRTELSVPMLQAGRPLGAITVARRAVGPFSEPQIALLQTFAEQAVIAIENVRLFTELQASNRDLTEALEQQTATSEILRVIASSPTDEQPVFETIVASALRLLNGHSAGLRTLHGNELHSGAFTSTTPSGDSAIAQGPIAVILVSSSAHFTRVVKDRTPSVIEDTETDSGLPPGYRQVARARGFRSGLAVPLLRGETVLGLINVTRRAPGPFSADDIALLQTFADQAVIAIENVRLFTELQEKNRALTAAHGQISEALERQTATADILSVISRSPKDVQPVFDAIVERAARLCDAVYGAVVSFDGELVRLEATRNWAPEVFDVVRRFVPAPPSRSVSTGRAILERTVVHLPDVERDPEYLPEIARAGSFRSILAVPMLRDGVPLGAITVGRAEPGPFSDNQIDAAPDLRRPGRHRYRECPPVQRAGGAQSREP